MTTDHGTPVIAIVGRANVGKSTLFNRLIRQRKAIVHDRPGVTRDRIFGLTEIQGRKAWLVDTGGLDPDPKAAMAVVINDQALRAIQDSNLVMMVFDGRTGLQGVDREVITMVRRTGKPTIAVINKIDTEKQEDLLGEFHETGFEPVIGVSAEHGRGIDELLEVLSGFLPPASERGPEEPKGDSVRVAFVGRPNVGKSSLINRILGEDRLVVSEEAGTTRDTTDTPFQFRKTDFLLLDTAGIRRRGKVHDDVEHYSVVRALRAIDRSDVAVLVVDAPEGITTQDARIVSAILDHGSGLLIAANKWDLKEDQERTRETFRQNLYDEAPHLHFAGVRFVSAKTGLGVDAMLGEIRQLNLRKRKRFDAEALTRAFEDVLEKRPPSGTKGFRLKLLGLTQASESAPTFFVWCNDPRLVVEEYSRYFRNALLERLELYGIPIRVIFRKRPVKSRRSGRK